MSEHGAILQSYNQELVKYIELLKSQRDQLTKSIKDDELAKESLLKDIENLNKKLEELNDGLNKKTTLKNNLEKTLEDTTNGMKQILASSELILRVIKHEATNYNKNV